MPALNRSNLGWPWMRLTEFGETVVAQGVPRPYDPEGYGADSCDAIPDLDAVVRDYISEAVAAQNRQLLRASSVMLGAASERLIMLLLTKWAGLVGGKEGERLLRDLGSRSIAVAYSRFKESFLSHRQEIG